MPVDFSGSICLQETNTYFSFTIVNECDILVWFFRLVHIYLLEAPKLTRQAYEHYETKNWK